jgi:hypothetical protein
LSSGWNSDPQNSPFFPLDRATLPASLSFASHKRTLAFYSSKEISPFGANRAKNAFREKAGKTASFFAAYPEIDRPEGQTGAAEEPD